MIFVKHTRAANRQCPWFCAPALLPRKPVKWRICWVLPSPNVMNRSAVTASVPASVPADKTESQRIRETIIAQLPEGQFTESLVAQLMEKVMKEKQSLEQGAMQPSFKSVTGKGGIKVIDGSSVKFGRFDGAEPHCVGLTDLVTGDDGSSMAAGFMQWENAFFPWTLNYDEIDMVLEGELHVRHEGETMIAKAGDVMFIPKGSSIEFGTTSSVKFLYVAWPANWQSL